MIEQLGYLAFEVADLSAWEGFATDVLGLVVTGRDGGALHLAMAGDDHAYRLIVRQGPADDLAAIGWQVADAAGLDELVARLAGAGVEVRAANADETDARRVDRLVVATDPAGITTELYVGPATAAPVTSPLVPGGFVAGDLGLGHLVVSAPDDDAARRFYCELLGFKLSDRILCEYYGHPVDITFFHVNGRHHTLAFGGPQPKKLHHFLLEVHTFDEVGMAFDRALRHRVTVAQTIGRHPNDRMISFYAHTPSGFQFEYGTGGRVIDDATWDPVVHHRISEWGHHPPAIVGRAGARPAAKPGGKR